MRVTSIDWVKKVRKQSLIVLGLCAPVSSGFPVSLFPIALGPSLTPVN